ncbi:MAG TPA: hypothetical protein DDY77_05305 [Clostridiales bacterium]|nr:hypothetical protein [Clostridiales bacterium]
MSLLIPLGLLGLLGVVGLIIIYIIKPNFQQKIISSTYVWKLSLKYRKRRLSTNKLRNIILIICQILILVSCAVILSQPVFVIKSQEDKPENVIVIDASASMLTEVDTTRFERAVEKARTLAISTFDSDGKVSLILADSKPSFLARRAGSESRNSVLETLDSLVEVSPETGLNACTYGKGDLDESMRLSQEIIEENPSAKVTVFTDKKFNSVPDGVNVETIRDDTEWNAGILNAEVSLSDGFYVLKVDVASYGHDEKLNIEVEVNGANNDSVDTEGMNLVLTADGVVCSEEKTRTVIFKYMLDLTDHDDDVTTYRELSASERFFSFKSILVSIETDDNYTIDNSFWIYGGTKERIKIQYASTIPNPFFQGILNVMRNSYADRYQLDITFVRPDEEAATEGFDFYIFEHKNPEKLPTDGVVFISDPDTSSSNGDFTLSSNLITDAGMTLSDATGGTDSILNNITPGDITLSAITGVTLRDDAYTVLLETNGKKHPALIYKNGVTMDNHKPVKVVLMMFSIHNSNLAVKKDFPLLMTHIFDYYFPTTVSGNAFEVSEEIKLNSRGSELTVTGGSYGSTGIVIQEFPATISPTIPGAYTISQKTFRDPSESITEEIYVRTPAAESNVFATDDALVNPYINKDKVEFYKDLLFYIALVLVALLFIEWWLQSRDNM